MRWELEQLFYINNELRNTCEETSDYEKALNDLYESFEGYLGIRFDFDEWAIDEYGDVIKHSHKEYQSFYERMWEKIYKMILFNTFKETFFDPDKEKNSAYDLGFRDGLARGEKIYSQAI